MNAVMTNITCPHCGSGSFEGTFFTGEGLRNCVCLNCRRNFEPAKVSWPTDSFPLDPEQHRERHIMLHKLLDELLADYLTQTKDGSITDQIVNLLQWSHAQTLAPTIHTGSYTNPIPVPHIASQIAQEDIELVDWLLGIANHKPTEPGDFLKALAAAALRADPENYPLMRPMLLHVRAKYPEYRDDGKSTVLFK
jgi:hypothetical protein